MRSFVFILLTASIALFTYPLGLQARERSWTARSQRSGGSFRIRTFQGETGKSFVIASSPDRLESPAVCLGPVLSAHGRADGSGAVWVWNTLSASRIMGSIYHLGEWGKPWEVSTSDRLLTTPAIAFDDSGGLWITWVFHNGVDDDITVTKLQNGEASGRWTLGRSSLPDILPAMGAFFLQNMPPSLFGPYAMSNCHASK